MAAIFKSSLQNLSPLLPSLKVEPLAKPKTSLKFFVNTTKPLLRPFVNTGPELSMKCNSGQDLVNFVTTGSYKAKDLKKYFVSINGAYTSLRFSLN